MNVSGDIRVGCTTNFRTGAIETNRYVTLVGASDSMQNYELTSYDDESLDGRVVVAPGTITYGTETYSVADAEPYLSHLHTTIRKLLQILIIRQKRELLLRRRALFCTERSKSFLLPTQTVSAAPALRMR